MPTPKESADRITRLFASGKQKVELGPEDVKNWHEISNLLVQMGFLHVNISGMTSATIAPYAIDATYHRGFVTSLSRFVKRLVSPRDLSS